MRRASVNGPNASSARSREGSPGRSARVGMARVYDDPTRLVPVVQRDYAGRQGCRISEPHSGGTALPIGTETIGNTSADG
jgi:hypothetical protein